MRDTSDVVRLGRQLRALRRRRGLRQADLAVVAGVSQSLVSLIERGHGERIALATLKRVAGAVDARVDVSLSWRAGDLDRLTDVRHAALASIAAALLRAMGWVVHAEVTYSIDGERGSIDLLAWHAATATLLVVEVKSELTSLEATLRVHDAKARLARVVAGRFGWRPRTVGRLIVLAETSTNRRRLAVLAGLAGPTFITDARAVRRWVRQPSGTLDAGWVLSASNPGGGGQAGGGFHRVRTPGPRSAPVCEARSEVMRDAAGRPTTTSVAG